MVCSHNSAQESWWKGLGFRSGFRVTLSLAGGLGGSSGSRVHSFALVLGVGAGLLSPLSDPNGVVHRMPNFGTYSTRESKYSHQGQQAQSLLQESSQTEAGMSNSEIPTYHAPAKTFDLPRACCAATSEL